MKSAEVITDKPDPCEQKLVGQKVIYYKDPHSGTETDEKSDDIALIRLTHAAKLNALTRPIQLPSVNLNIKGKKLFVSGFGKTEEEEPDEHDHERVK